MAGRPKKPPQVKMMEGHRLQKSRDNVALLERESSIPPPPKHLTDSERACWDELAAIVAPSKITSQEDAAAFETLAVTFAEWRHHCQEIRDLNGATTYDTTSRDGSVMHRAYPQYGLKADAERRLWACLARFGLNPSDRARLATGDDGKPKSGRESAMGEFA